MMRYILTIIIFVLAGYIIISNEIPPLLKVVLIVCLAIAEVIVVTML